MYVRTYVRTNARTLFFFVRDGLARRGRRRGGPSPLVGRRGEGREAAPSRLGQPSRGPAR
eukprot:7465561-Lingulodinium_polyedra.AAC.1